MLKNISNKNITINGLDPDAWIDAPDISITTLADDVKDLRYQTKIVAFLDLLGITEEIKKKVNGAESGIIFKMLKIKGIVDSEVRSVFMPEKINMLYVSDSFIFVCDEQILDCFLRVLSNIQMRVLVECKTLLRGALEYGSVIVQDEGKQIIGPAYIDAYQRQEHEAIYPRIIMGNTILNEFNLRGKNVVSGDREASLDYVGMYMESWKRTKSEMITFLEQEDVFKYLCEEYKAFNEKNLLSIRTKYAWTISYLKEKGVWSDAKQYSCW